MACPIGSFSLSSTLFSIFSSVYSHKDTTNPSFSAFLCPTFLRGITKKLPVPRRSGQCPNRPEDTPRPASRPSPIGRDALRKPAQYFAQSTRVLCGEYNPKLRKASSRFPQRKAENKMMFHHVGECPPPPSDGLWLETRPPKPRNPQRHGTERVFLVTAAP